jgi:hypothetical protein
MTKRLFLSLIISAAMLGALYTFAPLLREVSAGCECGTRSPTSCSGPGTCYGNDHNDSCPGSGNNASCDMSCNLDSGGTWKCGGGGDSGGCDESDPGPIFNSSPAHNTNLTVNSTVVTWVNSGGWGEGCDNNNMNKVQLQPGCVGGWIQVGGNAPRAAQAVNDLAWGTTYCWRVVRDNGGRSRASGAWRFTTPPPPTLDSSGFVPSTISQCTTAAASGRVRQNPTDPATNNPVTYFAEFSYVRGVADFRELRIAFVPASVSIVPSQRFNIFDPALRNYPAFKVTNLATTPTYSSIDTNLTPFFGPEASSGEITNAAGTAKLLNLNVGGATGTGVQIIDSDTIRVTWQVEFDETLMSNSYGVYVSGVAVAPNGTTLFSNGAGPLTSVGDQLRYVRATNWIIDMNPPLAQISSPIISGVDTIRSTWTATDTGTGSTGIADVRSYCYLAGGEATTMTDLHPIVGGIISLGITALNYPDASNCRVTSSTLGARDYRIDLETQSDIAFKLTAVDNACNIQTGTTVQPEPSPWLVSKDSSASAQTGFKRMKPRQSSLRNLYPDADAEDSYLSEYSVYSGGSMPSSRQSRNSQIAPGYTDEGTQPPDVSTTTSWYDFMEDIVSTKTPIQTLTGVSTITGSLRSTLNTAGANTTNSRTIVKLETPGGVGNLTIDGTVSATCDLNVVIFVDGNLIIRPNLARANNNSGCIFIVSGNVTVERGKVTNPAGRSLTLPALYDEVYALIVVDGTFSTTVDNGAGTGTVHDGLYIDGGVTAGQFNLKRNLGLVHNPSQPSEIFDYNPYYLYRFRDILEVTKFSLREK